MTPEQFTYWLQGKLEGRDITQLGTDELKSIHDHLLTVFHKVTPAYTPPDTTPGYTHTGKNPYDPPYTVIC